MNDEKLYTELSKYEVVKNHLWNRWQREYLTSLRQHYQGKTKSKSYPSEGDDERMTDYLLTYSLNVPSYNV